MNLMNTATINKRNRAHPTATPIVHVASAPSPQSEIYEQCDIWVQHALYNYAIVPHNYVYCRT